jgi:DNA end-binding protein Ku
LVVTARSIWQGSLVVQKLKLGVKVYSAVLDRQVHFHLLHKRDRTRLQQRMVEAETGTHVPLDQARKAFEAEPGLFASIKSEEIEQTFSKPTPEINVRRFVPLGAIAAQLVDHPYYLGPTADSTVDYFALAQALDRKKSAGIAWWVMRKHFYAGALVSQNGYLMLITLRHTEEIIPVDDLEPPQGRALEPKERDLAARLVETLTAHFHPDAYHEQYQDRVRELIDHKRAGKKLKPRRAPARRQRGSLADSLLASLKGAQK